VATVDENTSLSVRPSWIDLGPGNATTVQATRDRARAGDHELRIEATASLADTGATLTDSLPVLDGVPSEDRLGLGADERVVEVPRGGETRTAWAVDNRRNRTVTIDVEANDTSQNLTVTGTVVRLAAQQDTSANIGFHAGGGLAVGRPGGAGA